MKKILLNNNNYAIVDDEDFEFLNKFNWHKSETGYAVRCEKRKTIRMHRLIVNCPDDMLVDHINGNRLDNRKQNLRICTFNENIRNRKKHKNNSSGYKGVSYHKGKKKFQCRISYNGIRINLGNYECAKEAAIAYNKKAVELYGEFALLNEID